MNIYNPETQLLDENTTDLRFGLVSDDVTLGELKQLRQAIDCINDLEKLNREAKKYIGKGHVAMLVYSGNKAVGYVEIDESEDPAINIEGFDGSNYAHLSRLGVIKEARGKGYGKKLIEIAKKKAVDFGKKGLWLDFIEGNTPAKKIYESSGFSKLATYSDSGKNRVVAIKEI